MDSNEVWRLVAQARADVGAGEQPMPSEEAEAIAARMTQILTGWEPDRIVAFHVALWELLARSYRNDLWAAAYVIRGGCSDDGFDYFRGWLVAQGREVFEAAMADPDSLAEAPAVRRAAGEEDDAVECEDMLGVASNAYEEATGGEIYDHLSTDGAELPGLDPDWNFDFDDEAEMRRRLPRLTQLFYRDC